MQALWTILASLLFAWMGVSIKMSAAHHSVVSLMVWRAWPSVVVLLMWVWWKNKSLRGAPLGLQLRRGVAGVCSMLGAFYASIHLPIGIATVLQYTAPLFVMIDLMWLHQRPKESGWLDVLLLLIGFFGVIFVLHPQSQFYPLWAVLAGLLAGFFASLAYLQIKKLGQIKEPEWRTVLVFSTFVLVTALVLTFSVGEEKLILPVSLSDGMWLFSIGLSGMVAQLFLTRAYSRGSTILTANLQFVTIIFACFFGFLLWDDVIYWWEWLGIVLIVLGGVGATLRAK